jgi:hypothetical protein
VFTPVLAKHAKSFHLIDGLAVGVERIQRNFEPMQRQVEDWRKTQISDERAKPILNAALWTDAGSAPNARSCAVPPGRSPERTYALKAGPCQHSMWACAPSIFLPMEVKLLILKTAQIVKIV